MKKSMQQIMTVALSLLLVIAMVGCSDKQSGDTPQQSGTSQNGEQGETVTFKILRKISAPEYPADGGVGRTLLLEYAAKNGVTGVDFKVDTVAPNEYDSKLNLLAASGELPDYFAITLKTMNRFAEEDFLMELDSLAEKMPNAQKYWRPEDLEAAKYKGKLYAFPGGYRPEPVNRPYAGGFVVRKDWLENLGLEKPETLDDFYHVIKAFTLNDPDQNGENDTYGLGAQKADLSIMDNNEAYFGGIFGAYGVFPTFWHERDGQLKHGSTLPETKEVLALLQKWYKEKLIEPEFMIMDKKQREERMSNSKVGIVPADAWYLNPRNSVNRSLKQAVPEAELILIEPPKGPKGHMGWASKAPGYSEINAISAQCEHPELLVKFLDVLLKEPESGGPFVNAGIEGESFTYDQSTNTVNFIQTSKEQWAMGFAHPVQFIKVVDRRWVTEPTLKQGLEIANQYVIENDFWKTVPAMRDYPDLAKLWNKYFVEIVCGERSLDDWEEYVAKWYKQGGAEVEKQVNEQWKK